MGDPPGLIYPAGHGSGEITPPVIVYGILVVSYCYHGDGSGESIPNGDLPIVIWSCMLGTGEKKKRLVWWLAGLYFWPMRVWQEPSSQSGGSSRKYIISNLQKHFIFDLQPFLNFVSMVEILGGAVCVLGAMGFTAVGGDRAPPTPLLDPLLDPTSQVSVMKSPS
jgi:hypothetical protein